MPRPPPPSLFPLRRSGAAIARDGRLRPRPRGASPGQSREKGGSCVVWRRVSASGRRAPAAAWPSALPRGQSAGPGVTWLARDRSGLPRRLPGAPAGQPLRVGRGQTLRFPSRGAGGAQQVTAAGGVPASRKPCLLACWRRVPGDAGGEVVGAALAPLPVLARQRQAWN